MGKEKRNKRVGDEPIVVSSGNVFADFGIPEAEELQTKVKIAFALNTILKTLGQNVTQEQIAERLHTDQPKVSALTRYQLAGLSVEKLLDFITSLDYDIHIRIKRNRRRATSGRIHVSVRAA